MAIDVSEADDCSKGQYNFDDIVHPQMLKLYGKANDHQVKGSILLAEHNNLCQAFVIIPCPGDPAHKGVVRGILNLLSMLWSQQEWESTFLCNGFDLSCLITDNHFLTMVYNMVKLCEDGLKRSTEENFIGRESNFVSLLDLILPLLLQLLRCIHSLWKGQIACNLFVELESAKTLMNDEEDFQVNETRELLENIRESGYNLIGLCMSLEGAFADLLDSSSCCLAFVDFGSMEFRHLNKLIHIVLRPLVRHCPSEFWKEWMLDLLRPLLTHFEDILYFAWFSLMYEGRAKVAYYFGKLTGSKKSIEKVEHSLLLEFTRAVCQLLGDISFPESNKGLFHECFEDDSNRKMSAHQDLGSIASNSLIGYLLTHDCFGSLRMSLFGYWVDSEAARKAIPFAALWYSLQVLPKMKDLSYLFQMNFSHL